MNNSRTKNWSGLGHHLIKADFERENVHTAQMNEGGTMELQLPGEQQDKGHHKPPSKRKRSIELKNSSMQNIGSDTPTGTLTLQSI